MATPISRPRTARPYLWTLGICWLLPAGAVAAGRALLPEHNASGQCEGLGFGCTLSPADGVVLLGLVAAPFLIVAGLVACVLIAVVQHRRSRPPA